MGPVSSGIVKKLTVLIVASVALGSAACAKTFAAGAAVVNGVSISQQQLDDEVAVRARQQGDAGGESTLAQQREVLATLIQAELIRQEAQRRSLEPTAEEVEARIDALQGTQTDEQFLQQVEAAGLTLDGVRQRVAIEMMVRGLQEAMSPDVSDQDVRDVYDVSLDQFKQVRVKHILFAVEDPTKQDEVLERARATRVEILGGRSFEALARKRSDDPGSARNGGALPGWTSLANLDAGFAAGADAAKIGQVTAPVQSQYGWHLILVEARRTQPFSEVEDQLREQLSSQGAEGAFQDLVRDLVDRAVIVVNPRFGDWDPTTGAVAPHTFFERPEPETDPNAPPDLTLPPIGEE